MFRPPMRLIGVHWKRKDADQAQGASTVRRAGKLRGTLPLGECRRLPVQRAAACDIHQSTGSLKSGAIKIIR